MVDYRHQRACKCCSDNGIVYPIIVTTEDIAFGAHVGYRDDGRRPSGSHRLGGQESLF